MSEVGWKSYVTANSISAFFAVLSTGFALCSIMITNEQFNEMRTTSCKVFFSEYPEKISEVEGPFLSAFLNWDVLNSSSVHESRISIDLLLKQLGTLRQHSRIYGCPLEMRNAFEAGFLAADQALSEVKTLKKNINPDPVWNTLKVIKEYKEMSLSCCSPRSD